MRVEASSRGRCPRRRAVEFILIALAFVLLSLVIRAFDLDLRLSDRFHDPQVDPPWRGIGKQPWTAIYTYGTYPALLTGIVALAILLASIARSSLRSHRRSALFLVLVLAIGPGLLVNMTLKDHWGRPRPRETVRYGGEIEFLPVGQNGIPARGRSFPSGHAAMGFYFTALHVLWRRRRPQAARAGLIVGIAAGAGLGLQRIMVGGHFLSDVLWSGGIVYLTALATDAVLRGGEEERALPTSPWFLAGLGVYAAGIAFLATPFYREETRTFGPLAEGAWIEVAEVGKEGARRRTLVSVPADEASLRVTRRARGYGFFEGSLRPTIGTIQRGDTLSVRLGFEKRGRFTWIGADDSWSFILDGRRGSPTEAPLHPPTR